MSNIVPYTRDKVTRWAKHPSIISAELARKDTPDFGELLWVYKALIWFVVSSIVMTLSILDLSSQWTWHVEAAWALIASSSAWIMSLMCCVHHTFIGYHDPFHYKASEGLNWTGRKRKVLLHRNLKKMPWHGQRIKRLKEGDGRYNQMSVWMQPTNTGVQFHILEHLAVSIPNKMILGRVYPIRIWEMAGRPASQHIRVNDITEDAEKILEQRDRFEKVAEEAEETAYGNAIVKDKLKRTVLDFRR